MLAGKLTDFSIDDVFQLLTLTRKSGALRVQVPAESDGRSIEARVHFVGGAVCLATADVQRVEIGERLVHSGHLSDDQLRALSAEDAEGEALALVSRLIERDLVDREVLDDHIREVVHDTACMIVGLADGSFTFDAGLAASGWTGPTLVPDEVLVEARRRMAERESVADRLSSIDALLALSPALPPDRTEVTFDRDQWRVLALLDGRRTARQVAAALDDGEPEVYARIADLVDAGLVELGSPGAEPASDAVADAVQTGPPVEAAPTPDTGPQREPSGAERSPRESGPTTELDDIERWHEADLARSTQQAQTPDPVAQVPVPLVGAQGGHDEASSSGEHRGRGGQQPAAARRDVTVDRYVMARELSSLGLGDEAPLRRSVARAVTRPKAEPAPAPAEKHATRAEPAPPAAAPATAEGSTVVEHRLERDTRLNRGLLMRLIDGVRGI